MKRFASEFAAALAAMQDRVQLAKKIGKTYPKTDFGAKLLSADGMISGSTTVYEDGEVRETYRADLRGSAGLARRMRVRRRPGAKDDCFHVTKILVYGNKRY